MPTFLRINDHSAVTTPATGRGPHSESADVPLNMLIHPSRPVAALFAGQGCASDTDCRDSLQCTNDVCSCPANGSVDIGDSCTSDCPDSCDIAGNFEPGVCENDQCGKHSLVHKCLRNHGSHACLHTNACMLCTEHAIFGHCCTTPYSPLALGDGECVQHLGAEYPLTTLAK